MDAKTPTTIHAPPNSGTLSPSDSSGSRTDCTRCPCPRAAELYAHFDWRGVWRSEAVRRTRSAQESRRSTRPSWMADDEQDDDSRGWCS